MTSSLLDQLAEYSGIESPYSDARNKTATLNAATKSTLLSAMGYDVDNSELLLKQVMKQSTSQSLV